MYGGDKYQESVEIIVDLLKNQLKISDKNTIIIDVHSGLGPQGKDTLMVKSSKEKKAPMQFSPKIKINLTAKQAKIFSQMQTLNLKPLYQKDMKTLMELLKT